MSKDHRLFHLSDLHFGFEDKAALAWARDCIERERPDAVLITGDITMRARHREFAAAHEWIAGLDLPVTLELGNHDMPYFNLIERFTAPRRRHGRVRAAVERGIELPGIAVVALKSATRAQWRFPWSNGWVTPKALDRTLAQIDALPAGTRVIVTTHHPLTERSPKGKRLTIGGTRAMEALAARGVEAVLSGHVHDAFDVVAETRQGPLRMIGAGTLSQRLRASRPGFNELVVGAADIAVRLRTMDAS
jgi:3',5'-cyclic AMP phosphodiesterase CpdA